MVASKLYKYLDANGGLLMLQNSNLQFTNATKFNDPFDCHEIIKAAKRLNPEIKIYQMTTDSEVFRLKEQLIE